MHSVLISLASNYQHEKNLREAQETLAQVLLSSAYTPAIWTEPYGKKEGAPYLNQLVSAHTTINSDELTLLLKETEKAQGRNDEARRQGLVPIDLDILLFDGQRFHLRDWQRPYIQALLPLIPE